MPYSLCRFDEVFGELVDGLVAVPGNDALIVPDGDLLTDAAKFVHDLLRVSPLSMSMSRLMPSAGMLDIGYVALFAYREGIRTKIGSVRDVRSRGGFVIFR